MSAFIVDRFHIHQLVKAIDTYVRPTEEPTALGQMLWDENIASVSYRYNNEPLEDLPGRIGETYRYNYETPQRLLTPTEVYAALCCYRYQACEHDAWEASASCAAITELEQALLTQIGMSSEAVKRSCAYEEADWEIHDDEPRLPAPPTQRQPVRKISLVETARLVRKALREAYPGIKFAVRCSRYSMGQSIDVSWTDGPTKAMVQPLLSKFGSKSFDGMDDSTHYHTQEYAGDTVSFGADYVTGDRLHSADFLRKVACKVAAQYQVPVPEVK